MILTAPLTRLLPTLSDEWGELYRKGSMLNTDSDRPTLRMLAPEDALPIVRMTDCMFEISGTFASLANQFERLFVLVSDVAHGTPDDE